jgi:LacI family transcriptional regulator
MQKPRILLLTGYYVQRKHRGIVLYAREAGWQLNAEMTQTGYIPDGWEGDGIISAHFDREDILGMIRQRRVPTVDMSNGLEMPELPRMLHDNEGIGRMAGRYLAARGFRDIAYFVKGQNQINNSERGRGLMQEAEAAGCRFHLVSPDTLAETVKHLSKPFAIMGQNDSVAVPLIYRLQKLGLRIPQDVAVIGADNDDLEIMLSPVPLTSIDNNIEYCGYAAAAALDCLLQGKPVPAMQRIPPIRVVERESTNLFAVNDPFIAKALQLMRQHLRQPLSTEEIARHAGICRRRLDDRFKQHFGEPVNKYLTRLRIDCARDRLSGGEGKISDIADELGFSSASYFCTAFRQWTGQTPREFSYLARIQQSIQSTMKP